MKLFFSEMYFFKRHPKTYTVEFINENSYDIFAQVVYFTTLYPTTKFRLVFCFINGGKYFKGKLWRDQRELLWDLECFIFVFYLYCQHLCVYVSVLLVLKLKIDFLLSLIPGHLFLVGFWQQLLTTGGAEDAARIREDTPLVAAI